MLTSTPLFAQSDEDIKKEELPPGPIVAKLPDRIQWTIQFSYYNKPDGGAPSQVIFIKTGKFIHQTEVDVSGAKIERWTDGQVEAAWPSGRAQPYISLGAPSPNNGNPDLNPPGMIIDLNQNPLEEFSWVSPGNYLGVKSVNDQDCYVFRQGDGDKLQTAYIAKDSRFPVRVDGLGMTRLFVFEDPGIPQQSFPPNVQQFLNAISTMEGGQSTRAPR
jgi:hypothetical protein